MEVPTDAERELAAEVADFAQIATWDKAIQRYASEFKIKEAKLIEILDKVAAYNSKADPKGRIPALDDWAVHKANPEVLLPARGAGKSV